MARSSRRAVLWVRVPRLHEGRQRSAKWCLLLNLQGIENNCIKGVACSRYFAMGSGCGLYARYEGFGVAVVYRCVCVVG